MCQATTARKVTSPTQREHCDSREADSLELRKLGSTRAHPQHVVVHSEKRVDSRVEPKEFFVRFDFRHELVRARTRIICDMALRLLTLQLVLRALKLGYSQRATYKAPGRNDAPGTSAG